MYHHGGSRGCARGECKSSGISSGMAAAGLLTLILIMLMLIKSEDTSEYISDGLKVVVSRIIPAVFPFAVMSELLVSFGILGYLGRLIAPVLSPLGVSGEGAGAFLLGTVCGFPVGARASIRLYREGRITKKECEHLLTFSNCPSPSFVIGVVGVGIYSSKIAGAILWSILLAATLISGLISKWILYGRSRSSSLTLDTVKAAPECRQSIGQIISASISTSAITTLNVCAFVVFFRTVVGLIGQGIGSVCSSETVISLAFSLFEMSSGVFRAASIDVAFQRSIIVLLALGWSGISVHCQIASVCYTACSADKEKGEESISLFPYLLSKLMTASIGCILFILLHSLIGRVAPALL